MPTRLAAPPPPPRPGPGRRPALRRRQPPTSDDRSPATSPRTWPASRSRPRRWPAPPRTWRARSTCWPASELDEAKANSLGETVSKLPGVQSSYFGPGVGRPIMRGFDGARVQVLSDGLGSGDVSTVSVDHAVSIEPFLADQIEVLKGPATLLYGSGAIGGAVNVVDGRIPEAVTDEPLQGRAELRGNTVNDEKTGMFRLDGTVGLRQLRLPHRWPASRNRRLRHPRLRRERAAHGRGRRNARIRPRRARCPTASCAPTAARWA